MKKLRLRFLHKIWKSLGASGVGKEFHIVLKRRGIFYTGEVMYRAGGFFVRVWRKGRPYKYPRVKAEVKDGFKDAWSAAEWGENQIPFRKVRS